MIRDSETSSHRLSSSQSSQRVNTVLTANKIDEFCIGSDLFINGKLENHQVEDIT